MRKPKFVDYYTIIDYQVVGYVVISTVNTKMFNSETFNGVVNVNVTTLLGNSHYFVDKSGYSEELKASKIWNNH